MLPQKRRHVSGPVFSVRGMGRGVLDMSKKGLESPRVNRDCRPVKKPIDYLYEP